MAGTQLSLDFADGTYSFRLTWPGCAEVERKCNAGIQAIYERVMLAASYRDDVSEIIRQGLLGGAGGIVDDQPVEVKPPLVNALLERYVTGPEMRPFSESWNIARAVLSAFMVGHEDAQKKSAEGEGEPAPTTESTQPRSSPTAP